MNKDDDDDDEEDDDEEMVRTTMSSCVWYEGPCLWIFVILNCLSFRGLLSLDFEVVIFLL